MASSSRVGRVPGGRDAPRRRSWGDVAVVVAVALVVLPRMVPGFVGDRGIFVSTAERLRAGDVLYRDVWDNKDPLFYYLLALGREVSDLVDVVLELGWMAGAVAATAVLAAWAGCDRRTARLLALGATTVVLTGSFYVAGNTHLPGTALCLLAAASVVSRRFVLSGVLCGVLLFTKAVMAPVVLLILAPMLWRDRAWPSIARMAVGGSLALMVGVAVLAARGELGPYADALARNASYSGGPFLVGSEYGSVVGHLGRFATFPVLWVCLAVTGIVAWSWRSRREAPPDERRAAHEDLRAAVVGSFLAAWVVLALTGLWEHHAQVLYVPALLAVVLLVAEHPALGRAARPAAIVPVAVGLLVAGPWVWIYAGSVGDAADALSRYGEVPPEARALIDSGPVGTYARVGSNDDLGHAVGLDEWTLACPRFHQYFFEPVEVLVDVTDCLPDAEAIVVSGGVEPIEGNAGWNDFVERVEAILRADRRCTESDGLRVCRRIDG